MKRRVVWTGLLSLAALLIAPLAASARGLSVELWTDRGSDAVYQTGDPIQIKARTSQDAFLLVYEIDAEGAVHLLFPSRDQNPEVEARHTYRLPDDDRGELVVDATTGEGYIIAIASDTPFDELPWYLRPYDPQGDDLGYVGTPDQEEGITADGRIVGDPFVAMERIRRRVLRDSHDGDSFATAYTTYYVHEHVRYPRYVCYDCHRPGLYSWWSGFDPYYTTCSVFDFRVNWSWGWGPRYWYGNVPYFVYVYRDDCPPAYRRYSGSGTWYSSWDGWNRWCDLWGAGGLRRYKSAPPVNYVPPNKWATSRSPRDLPPGFIAAGGIGRQTRTAPGAGIGMGNPSTGGGGGRERREGPFTAPGREARPDAPGVEGGRTPRGSTDSPYTRGGSGGPGLSRPRDEGGGSERRDVPPAFQPRPERQPERPREFSPPRQEPRRDPPRQERAPDPPRQERAPDPPRQERAPAPTPPRDNGNGRGNHDSGRGNHDAGRDSGGSGRRGR